MAAGVIRLMKHYKKYVKHTDRPTLDSVYISQLIRFARLCSNVDDFNNRNLFLTAKLLKQGYRYHKIQKSIF